MNLLTKNSKHFAPITAEMQEESKNVYLLTTNAIQRKHLVTLALAQ